MSSKTVPILTAIAASILLSDPGLDIIKDIKRYDPKLEFVVSSNLRDTGRQAKELARRLKSGKKLNVLYKAPKAVLGAIERAYILNGEAGIKEELDRQQARGTYMSKHMCGKGLDLYSYQGKLTMVQVYNRLKNIPGYKVLNEKNHIHVETIEGC